MLKHQVTTGKTNEGMSATTNAAAEYYANVARAAATAILDGVMAAASNNAEVLATIEKAIPEGPQRETYTRWLDQYRSYDPGTGQSRVPQRHIRNHLHGLAVHSKDVTFTPNTHQE